MLADDPTNVRDLALLCESSEQGVTEILTFDAGFDGYPGITRLH